MGLVSLQFRDNFDGMLQIVQEYAMKKPSETYLEKAGKLTKQEAVYLFSRMGAKLGRRMDDNKLIPLEALALQLEKEDKLIDEWREKFAEIRALETKKKSR